MNETKPQTSEDLGSRDLARKLIKEAETKMLEIAVEIGKLRHANRKDVAYRYADVYVARAMTEIELLKIVMRKRKRSNEKRVEVPTGAAEVAPPAPI